MLTESVGVDMVLKSFKRREHNRSNERTFVVFCSVMLLPLHVVVFFEVPTNFSPILPKFHSYINSKVQTKNLHLKVQTKNQEIIAIPITGSKRISSLQNLSRVIQVQSTIQYKNCTTSVLSTATFDGDSQE